MCTILYHDYVHVEMEVENQENILIFSQRVFQRKLISEHLILFHNDRCDKLERIEYIKNEKNRKLYRI